MGMRMRVAVMDVGIVGMPMGQHLVTVRMRMRLGPVPCESVLMPVMCVMPVTVSVQQRKVGVLVLMAFPHVQPYAHGHESRCAPEEGSRQPWP